MNMEEILQLLLDITTDIYFKDLHEIDGKHYDAINAEYVDKMSKILTQHYSEVVTLEQIETIRQSFLNRTFGS